MKRGRIFLFLVPLFLIAIGASYYFYALKIVSQWDNKIYPTTYVKGINLSGKTREEAKSLLEESVKPIYNKKLNIKVGEDSYSLDYSLLNPGFNIDEIVNEAYAYGKNGGIFSKLNAIKRSNSNSFDMKFSFSTQKIDELIDKIEKKLSKSPINATLEMTDPGTFIVTREKDGVVFDKEGLRKDIVSSIKGTENDETEFTAKLEKIKPPITYDLLNGVNSLVSSFSTYYNPNVEGRAYNIQLATKKISGALLLPGDTFSFNERTGKRNASNGYKTAPVIVNNKMEDGPGGGVCQVSTTLYNAVIRCNIMSLSRRNHSLAPYYVKPGFDATVSDSTDYKFKNTLNYPVYIYGYASNGKVTFNIYSDSSLNSVKYDLISQVYEKTEAKLNRVNDPTLPKGKIEEDSIPHHGYKVRVYLVGKRDGREVSNVLISKDTYKKTDGLMRIGTKI